MEKDSNPEQGHEEQPQPKTSSLELPDQPRARTSSKNTPCEDFRTVGKASRIGDAIQLADQHIRDLGIICSINKVEDDKYIIGSYHRIAHWTRKSKDLQVENRAFGGSSGFTRHLGDQAIWGLRGDRSRQR